LERREARENLPKSGGRCLVDAAHHAQAREPGELAERRRQPDHPRTDNFQACEARRQAAAPVDPVQRRAGQGAEIQLRERRRQVVPPLGARGRKRARARPPIADEARHAQARSEREQRQRRRPRAVLRPAQVQPQPAHPCTVDG
jgi:hypothetical protein